VSRIRIPKDKADIVNKLVRKEDSEAPFRTQADLIAFAASLGFSRGIREPFSETLEPIRQDVFDNAGYRTLFNLLALASTGDPNILSSENEDQRITIFEEYANAGLSLLKNELQGSPDPLDDLLLIVRNYSPGSKSTDKEDEFDLSRFLR